MSSNHKFIFWNVVLFYYCFKIVPRCQFNILFWFGGSLFGDRVIPVKSQTIVLSVFQLGFDFWHGKFWQGITLVYFFQCRAGPIEALLSQASFILILILECFLYSLIFLCTRLRLRGCDCQSLSVIDSMIVWLSSRLCFSHFSFLDVESLSGDQLMLELGALCEPK